MKHLNIFLLLILPFFSRSQTKIFFNARIFTANADHPFAEAIAIGGKKIIAVGSYTEVKQAAGNAAEIIDCKGGFLMPGFVDSHIHAIEGGQGLSGANVSDRSMTVRQLLAYCQDVLGSGDGMRGDVLAVSGINIGLWSDLDEVISQFNSSEFARQPVMLFGSDGHTSWANLAMMQRAGLDRNFIQSLQPADKVFYGITKNGDPNGFVSESGQDIIRAAIPKDTAWSRAAQNCMAYCNGLGITALLDPAAGNTLAKKQSPLDAYAWLVNTGKMTAHVSATIVCDPAADPAKEIDLVQSLQKKYNGEELEIIGCKIFADGVIEHPTHTAALSLPYTGTSSRGVLMYDPKKFQQFAIAADKANLLIHVHAIGDRAVTGTLNAFEEVRKTNGNFTLPHTITHLQIVLPSDFQRFAKLHVLASFQLLWAAGDFTTIDIVKPYIDPSLYKWQYPAQSLFQAGAIICGASDWPVSSPNPFQAIYVAETRRGAMGVLDSTQCMSRLSMFYAYTINAAKALMRDKQIGSLEPGKSADMIMLDRDPLTASPTSMNETKVRWTLFEGRQVYKAQL